MYLFWSVCSSWSSRWLQPSTSWLPASPRLQRRIPQPWKLQPGWRAHSQPRRIPQRWTNEGQHGTQRRTYEQGRPSEQREHEQRRWGQHESWWKQGTSQPGGFNNDSSVHTILMLLDIKETYFIDLFSVFSFSREVAIVATLATRTETLATTGTAATLETETAWTRPKPSIRAGSKGSVFLLNVSACLMLQTDYQYRNNLLL